MLGRACLLAAWESISHGMLSVGTSSTEMGYTGSPSVGVLAALG